MSEQNNQVELYEGELMAVAGQALEVVAKKVNLKCNIETINPVYLEQIADHLLTALKSQNNQVEVVVVRKKK